MVNAVVNWINKQVTYLYGEYGLVGMIVLGIAVVTVIAVVYFARNR